MEGCEKVEAGQMFFINQNEICALSSKKGCTVQILRIDGEKAAEDFPEMKEVCFGSTTLRYEDKSDEFNYGRDRIFLSDCLNHYYEKPSEELTEQGKFILSLLCLEYDRVNDREGAYNYISDDKKQRIKRIFAFVKENYHRKITLQEAAEKEGVTPQYLTSLWKENFSNSLMSYVAKLRMNHVGYKLLFSEDPIQKIIFDSGFQEAKSFYASFHKWFNESPTSWKRKMKQKKNEWRMLPFEEASLVLEKVRKEKDLFEKPMDSVLYQKYKQLSLLKNHENDLKNFKVQVYPYDTYKMNETEVTPLFMFGYDLLMREVYRRSLELVLVIEMNIFEKENLEEFVGIQQYIYQSILRFGRVSLSKWFIELKCQNEAELHRALKIKDNMTERGISNIQVLF